MKRIIQLCLLIFGLLICFGPEASAQRSKDKKSSSTDKYFDESGGFSHRLWYGGGFLLGFSSNSAISQFAIGLSPMVGYKIIENFSFGPRASLRYNLLKTSYFDGNQTRTSTANPVDWSIGLFTRYKVFKSFFAHAEMSVENETFVLTDGRFPLIDQNGDMVTSREQNNNVYLGAGYNSSQGVWGYEIVLLYHVNQPENDIDIPIDLRFGVTYNF